MKSEKGKGSGDEPRGAVGGFSMEAPKFSGIGSLNRFLSDLDTFYTFHNFDDDFKLRFLPLCLTSVARDAFEALSQEERGTYSAAVTGLRRFFDRSSTLEAHSRLRELKFDPASPLDTFVVQFKQLARDAFPGISSDQVLFHSFLSTLPARYQQQLVAAGVSTFDEAVDKVRNLIQSERIPTAVRQVSTGGTDRSVLEQILSRLEQLESQVRSSVDGRGLAARGSGSGGVRGVPGRGRRPDGGGTGRSCFACGSLSHIRRTCPHRQSRCYGCGELGHLSRVCPQGNELGFTVPQSANQCTPNKQ